VNLDAALKLSDAQLARLSKKTLADLQVQTAEWIRADQKANQLVYYRVANPEAVKVIHIGPKPTGLGDPATAWDLWKNGHR